MRWVKYGMMWLSAGITTGVVSFWWLRQSPVVSGQDVAECYAARCERVMAFHKGSNVLQQYTDLTPSSNAVSYVHEFSYNVVNTNYANTSYVYTATATPRVKVIGSTNWVFTGGDWTTNRYVHFTATNIVGGNSTVTWDFKDENGVIATLTTVRAPSYFDSGLSYTNRGYVIYPAGYMQMPDGYDAIVTLSRISMPSNNIGVVTNVIPVYEPIDQPGAVSDFMFWRTLYDNVMSATRDLAVIPANRNDWIMAVTNTVSSNGVADVGSYDFTHVLWLDSRNADLADGQVIMQNNGRFVVVDRTSNHLVNVTHVDTYYGIETDMTNVVETLATSELRWPNTGVRYAPSVSGTNLPVVEALADALTAWTVSDTALKQPSATIASQDNWWKYIGNGTNAYRFWCENADASNNVVSHKKWLAITNLYETKHMLDNMQRTVYVIPITDCEKLSAVKHSYNGSTNNGAFAIQNTGDYPVFKGNDWWDAVYADPSMSYTSNNVALSEYLVQYGLTADEEVYRLWNTPDLENDSDYIYSFSASVIYDVYQYAMKSPYPSEWSCAHTNVAKIRIYGVPLVYPVMTESTPNHTGGETGWTYTFMSGTVQEDQYDWSLFSHYNTLHTLPTIEYTQDNGTFIGLTDESGYATKEFKLALIGEWTSPTSRPAFNIGTNMLSLPPFDSIPDTHAKWQGYYVAPDPGVGRLREYYEFHNFGMRVHCPVIVVEVWWKWEHLGETAYEPAVYTPEWAVTNSP